jgi:hypothetical protein
MVKLSDKTVDQFIRKPEEKQIKDFFMNRIDPLLRDYDPGHPKWKPDVAIQMEQLKKEREEIMQKMQQQHGIPQIMVNVPGQPPRPLSPQEIMQLLQENQMMVQKLTAENEHLKATFQKQVQEMIVLKKRVKELEAIPPPVPQPVPVPVPVPESVPVPLPPSLDNPIVFEPPKTKSEPEIRLSQL